MFSLKLSLLKNFCTNVKRFFRKIKGGATKCRQLVFIGAPFFYTSLIIRVKQKLTEGKKFPPNALRQKILGILFSCDLPSSCGGIPRVPSVPARGAKPSELTESNINQMNLLKGQFSERLWGVQIL